MARFLFDGPEHAETTILLAHGAGAPMDSPSLTAAAGFLAEENLRIARFEFGYMADRRSGIRRPPPRAETLIPEYRAAIADMRPAGRLIIGGKSMGGRVASMLADEVHSSGGIVGLLCLGYPFHPPDKPAQTRIAHLADITTPTLICQGTRDPFGGEDEVAGYRLSDRIEILWLADGDHDLKPRKRVTGLGASDHLRTVAAAVATWAARIG